MIQIIKADGAAELALIDNLRTRAAEIGEEINRTAAQMMADVKERGYEAVREYSVKLDGAEPKEFSKEELQAAYDACAAPKQLVLVPDAGHGCSYLVDRPRVQAELAAFLSKYVSEEEPI